MKDSFGARLKFFRSKAGLSQQQLADKTGLSRKIISDYEVKLHAMPRETNLYKIADALNIDSSNLVPKTDISESMELPDGSVEFKINLYELPKDTVETIKELAVSNNRSIEDEFNYVVNQAISSALQKYERGEKSDYSEFDKKPEQQNELIFDLYLKNQEK